MRRAGSESGRECRKAIPWNDLKRAAGSSDGATDLTHSLYRYPASMSPQLTRALILALTKPGDVVLDPFCGGGATAIETLAHGRQAVCSDLNALACFVTHAKAWPLGQRALQAFHQWADSVERLLLRSSRIRSIPLVIKDGLRSAPRTHALLWGLRNSALGIPGAGVRRFALLAVLRAGQLCFDCRKEPANPSSLIRAFRGVSIQALTKMHSYSAACGCQAGLNTLRRRLTVVQSDAAHLGEKLDLKGIPISLILTSPPYPGVHVLYHRWQVLGRRETALPYSLLAIQDGLYESHYTLGPRREPGKDRYFQRLASIFTLLRPALNRATIVAQVVGFSDPKRHLARFREAMSDAGYDEVIATNTAGSLITRIIPHRRWYAEISPRQESAREYLLIHKVRARRRKSTKVSAKV